MINLLIKLLIYIIFVIILPQFCTGALQLFFKSIGFVALCDLFYYNLFYKSLKEFDIEKNPYIACILVILSGIFLNSVLCDIINSYDIEFYLLTLGIIIAGGMTYLLEVILDKR